MVVQKTIDNLKDRPHDERKAVAGGVAIFVVVVLLIGWGIMFVRKISNGTQEVNFDSGAQEEFNFAPVNEAQKAIEGMQGYSPEDLSRIRDEAAERQLQGQQQAPAGSNEGTDAFQPPPTY